MSISGRVRLRDLRPLSSEEHTRARQICFKIRDLVEIRDSYVRQHKLIPEIADPGANWGKDAENAIHNLYDAVVKGDYEILNRLRFFTQPFTGYQLTTMSMGFQKTRVPELTPDFDEQLERIAPGPDRWIERYSLIAKNVPKQFVPQYPLRLGEIGWNINGALVNHDIYSYQERLNLLFEAGIFDLLLDRIQQRHSVSVLEVGGGYGGLAYGLARILGRGLTYLICDIPESLLFSAIYLGLTLPEHRHTIYDGRNETLRTEPDPTRCHFIYIPNYMFDEFISSNSRLDVAINTLSLVEMTEDQVRYYASHIKRLIGQSGVFFEQNHDGRWRDLLDCKPILEEYFACRTTAPSRTIPVPLKGTADVWSNADLGLILESSKKNIFSSGQKIRMFFWRIYCLLCCPELATIRLRSILQSHVKPGTFTKAKGFWNKLGGNLEA